MRQTPLLLLGLFALTLPAPATDYAGDFEELGTSARAIGMGGAVVAGLAGPAAIYYNPALAGRNEGTGLLFLHSEDFTGLVQHNFLGASFSSRLQSFGVAVLHNGVPGIKLTALPDTTLPPGENNRPYVERIVSANQLVGYFNYARILSPLVALGANAKVIYQDLGVGSCFGMGLDLGLALTPVSDLCVGLRVRNASTSPLFWTTGTREQVLPRVALGVDKTFRLGRDALKLALEVSAITENLELGHNLGVEYSFRNALYGRVGMHQGNLTFGLGGRYRRFYVDYGYASGYAAGSRELGSAQQFSGGVEF
ncbi:hypothetical protein JXB37_04325 [candidate division WOR-3 bacterium]|nr:hypothetical protein [candidate division WOR-3 bacterium]